jgi:hypothetical protein
MSSGLSSACEQVAPLLVFYACDELDSGERSLVDQHLASCSACRSQLAIENEFRDALGSLPQAADRLDGSGVLLAQCRSELSERLDDLVQPPVLEKTPVFSAFRRWMALRPAWSAAALVVLGLVGGAQVSQWYAARSTANPLDQAVNVRPGPQFSDDQLSKMAVAGINFSPASGNQNVRLQLSAQQPVELDGNLDNADVRHVLTYVVKNGERFDPGVRLDCLDALRARAKDAEVQSALLMAARKDANPAVRLKALEALRDSSAQVPVRAALLDALQHDTNSGVRVEAVNLLVISLEQSRASDVVEMDSPDQRVGMVPAAVPGGSNNSLDSVIRALEELQRNDPNRYVRMRSAAALRQITSSDEQ